MANTIGGINLAQIAQETLKTLLTEMPPLSAFTTDFSADISQRGESVATRVATAPSASDASSSYSASDVTTTAKTITLNKHYAFVAKFTDLEVAKGTLDMLTRVFIRPGAHAVANQMMDDLLALVTNANFGTAGFAGAAAEFDDDDVIDLARQLTDNNVPRQGRFLMLNPSFYAALAQDTTIRPAYAYGGTELIRENEIPRLHKFSVYEYSDIPGNSENLVGLCGGREGLLLAARVPATPMGWAGETETVQDPDTGLALQLRSWYEGKEGHYLLVTLIYGVAAGVTNNVLRITT